MVDVGQIRLAAAKAPVWEAAPPGPGRAAVAVILRDADAGAQVLLIRRAERPGDPWSGHMGLPGGRWESGDPELVDTAIRETREEVGLDLTLAGTPLGCLRTIPAVAHGRRTGLTITPFLFAVAGDPRLQQNDEIAETLWVPIDVLQDRRHRTTVEYERDGRKFRLPAWEFHGRIIWGLTHAMLTSLLALLPAPTSNPPADPAVR